MKSHRRWHRTSGSTRRKVAQLAAELQQRDGQRSRTLSRLEHLMAAWKGGDDASR